MVEVLGSFIELVRWDEPWDVEADDPPVSIWSAQ
jgi:hypothetical protein